MFAYDTLFDILEGEAPAYLSGFLAFYAIFYIVAMALGILSYIFFSLGLMKMGQKLGIAKSFLAFIPFGSSYYMGKIAEKDTRDGYAPKRWGRKLLTFEILMLAGVLALCIALIVMAITGFSMAIGEEYDVSITTLLGSVPVLLIGFVAIYVFAILYSIYYYICLAKIYRLFAPGKAVLLTVLSIFFSVIVPFVFFAIRKNRPHSPYTGRPLDGGPDSYGDYYGAAYAPSNDPYGRNYPYGLPPYEQGYPENPSQNEPPYHWGNTDRRP